MALSTKYTEWRSGPTESPNSARARWCAARVKLTERQLFTSRGGFDDFAVSTVSGEDVAVWRDGQP
ncbi:hypothetical protein GCM10009753_51480 [Streptantibioticus ferralitis]